MNLLDKSRILVTILGFVIFVPLISCQQSTYTCKPTGTNFNCSCVFNAQSNGTYVNCKAEGLTSFPLSFDDIQDEPIVLLELANNSIRTIGETDLNNYEYLETLVLDNCQLTSDTNTYAFYDNAALVTVILANNPELKKVPLPPVSIQELDLSNCGLNDTGSDVLDLKNLEDAPYLFELTLDNNGLSEWPINIPPKLGVLKLRDNYLTTIMTDIGSSLTRLEYLHLDNNKITTLDSNTPSMPDSLHELSLDSNPIYTLNNDYFHNMNFIEDLSVSFTNINFISSIVFQGMFPMYSGHRIRISFQHNAYLEEISKGIIILSEPGFFVCRQIVDKCTSANSATEYVRTFDKEETFTP
ncbi:uncharacterized protein LOC142338123 [Convolutriloba macropyga]|uniref:uncharacterized protein LOC142338123 n=1 Tax=Convolutriloba macropyga TaxID=536237 RepID=UPI003F52043A